MDRFAGRWMEVQGMFETQAPTEIGEYCAKAQGTHSIQWGNGSFCEFETLTGHIEPD